MLWLLLWVNAGYNQHSQVAELFMGSTTAAARLKMVSLKIADNPDYLVA